MDTSRIFIANTGNPVIDAVLDKKNQIAQEKNVTLRLQVNDLAAFPLPLDAMVVLLSNLLDNAIEAAEKCAGAKEIECNLLLENTLYISVGNTSQEVSIINGQVATTKADNLNHGYGLATIRGILDQWNAEYAFNYSGGWFQFAAEVPIPE